MATQQLEPEEHGQFHAVCCTSELMIKDVNRFLDTFYRRGKPSTGREAPKIILVMQDIQHKYIEATIRIGGSGKMRSPFIGKNVEEVPAMLYNHKRDIGSNLQLDFAILLNHEGMEKHWVQVLSIFKEHEAIYPDVPKMVKVDWDALETVLSGLFAATTDWERVHEWSLENDDGVVRFP